MKDPANPASERAEKDLAISANDAKTQPVSPSFGERSEWMILQSVRLAMRPSYLFFAAWGAIAGSLGWMLLGLLLLPPVSESDPSPAEIELRTNATYFQQLPGGRSEDVDPLGWSQLQPVRWSVERVGQAPDNPLTAVPYRIIEPFFQLLQPQMSWRARFYYLLGGAWTWLVWSIVGGAITHMAILHFAREQSRDPQLAFRYALTKIPSHLGAMLLPTVAVLLLSLPIAILGAVMRSDFGLAVVGLVWIVVLPIAMIMAMVVLAWAFGWPLIWGALSSEGMDAFDAFSRSMSYTFQKPVRYVWYLAVAAAGGLVGWLFVWAASEMIVQLASYSASLGTGRERMVMIMQGTETGGMSGFGAGFIRFWNGLVRTFGSAFAFSYFWAAMSAIYLLLRYEVDATELDEVECESDPASVYGRVVVPGEDEKSAFAKSRLLRGEVE